MFQGWAHDLILVNRIQEKSFKRLRIFLVLTRGLREATLYLLQDMIKEACSPNSNHYYQPYCVEEVGTNLRMMLTFWMVREMEKLWVPHDIFEQFYLWLCIFLWFKSLVLKLWSMDWQHQHHLWAYWKWRISGPNLVLLNENLHFSRIPRWFICTQKLQKYYFKPLRIGFLFTYKWKHSNMTS